MPTDWETQLGALADAVRGKAAPPPPRPGAPAAPWQWQYAQPGPYVTPLTPNEETRFRQWLRDYRSPTDPSYRIPFDPSPRSDYDMRGYWKALQRGDPEAKQSVDPNDKKLHFPDIWKTPYHETFSAESMYATPDAPTWNKQDQLIDKHGRILFDDRADPQRQAVEPPALEWQTTPPVNWTTRLAQLLGRARSRP